MPDTKIAMPPLEHQLPIVADPCASHKCPAIFSCCLCSSLPPRSICCLKGLCPAVQLRLQSAVAGRLSLVVLHPDCSACFICLAGQRGSEMSAFCSIHWQMPQITFEAKGCCWLRELQLQRFASSSSSEGFMESCPLLKLYYSCGLHAA